MNNPSQKNINKDVNTDNQYLTDEEVLASFKKLEKFIKNLDQNKSSFYSKEEILVALKKLEKLTDKGLSNNNKDIEPKFLNKNISDEDFLINLRKLVKQANPSQQEDIKEDKTVKESTKELDALLNDEIEEEKKETIKTAEAQSSNVKKEAIKTAEIQGSSMTKEDNSLKEKRVKLVENEKLEISSDKKEEKKEPRLEDLFRVDTFSPQSTRDTNNKAQKAIENLLGDNISLSGKGESLKPIYEKKSKDDSKDQIQSLGETLNKKKETVIPFLKKHEPETTEKLYDKKGNFNYYKYFQADEGEEILKYCSSSIKKLADPSFNKATKAGIIENLKKEKQKLEKQIDALISIEPTGDIYIITDKNREKAFDGKEEKVVLEYKEGLGDKIAKKLDYESKSSVDDKYNETMLNASTDLSVEASEWIVRNYPKDKTLSLKSLRSLTDKTVAENINKFEGKTIDFSGVANFSEEALEVFRTRPGYMMLSGLEVENLTDAKLKILKNFKSKCFFSDDTQAKIDNF